MTDRARVTEAVQIGVETTPGTAVAAPTNIRAMSVGLSIPGEAEFFRPDGRKFNALAMTNMEWSQFDVSGKPTYTEIIYPLIAMFGSPAPSTVGTLGKKRIFSMLDTTLITPKTLTVEKGNSVRAEKIAGFTLTDLGLEFSRSSLNLTGQAIGRLFTDGISLTSSPADIALIPILGKHLDVYVDATAAGLGTTKLLRAFSVKPQLTGAHGPVWPINSANSSFADTVNLAPTTSCEVKLEADSAGMAYLSQFRTDDLLFLRVQATGPELEVGTPYALLFDICLGIKSVKPDDEENGVTVVTYQTEFVKDSTWGKAMELAVTNLIAGTL